MSGAQHTECGLVPLALRLSMARPCVLGLGLGLGRGLGCLHRWYSRRYRYRRPAEGGKQRPAESQRAWGWGESQRAAGTERGGRLAVVRVRIRVGVGIRVIPGRCRGDIGEISGRYRGLARVVRPLQLPA